MRSCASGSTRQREGPSKAITARIARIEIPITALAEARKRVVALYRPERQMALASPRWVWRRYDMARGRCSRCGAPQRKPVLAESRIEKRRQRAGEDVDDENHHRDDPDERFDQRDIARRHRVERQSTNSGIRENTLDDHRAPEQESHLQPGERQRRQRRVAQRVSDQDPGP